MANNKPALNKPSLFDQAENLPELDAKKAAREAYKERSKDELAALDRDQDAEIRRRFGSFVITPNGLDLQGEPVQADWQQVGSYLFQMQGSIQWLIGDWLIYGEKLKWGDIKKIAEENEYNYTSLRMYAHVSRSLFIRINNLSWNHHLLVASKTGEEQEAMLQYALDNRLSVAAFREWLKGEPPALPARIMDKEHKNRFNQLFRTAMQDLASVDTVEMMVFDAWWQDFKQQVRMAKK